VNALTEGVLPPPLFAATLATAPLPAPWATADVGSVGGSGAAGYSSGTFTAIGSGGDIWNNADALPYLYQGLTGNGTIIARVVGLDNTDGYAKAGVMLRESLAGGSKNAMMEVTAGNGVYFQYRDTTNGGSASAGGGNTRAPYWVRISRVGNTY